jgi:hypothetical protein
MVIAGIALLAFVITLVVSVSVSGAKARRAAQEIPRDAVPRASSGALSPDDLGITADDFLLPGIAPVDLDEHYTPFRQRLTKWSPALIARYWIPPRQIATEIISSLNDQNLRELFQRVP